MQDYTINDDLSGYELNIDVLVQDQAWSVVQLNDIVLKVAKAVIAYVGLDKYTKAIEFAVILTGNAAIADLNQQYRGKNQPTNTLSFPAQEINVQEMAKIEIDDGFVLLGDVIFAYDVIFNEAQEQKKSFKSHFTHLLVHSLLHLLGFDHEEDNQAEEMEKIEVEILSDLGVKSPYDDINN